MTENLFNQSELMYAIYIEDISFKKTLFGTYKVSVNNDLLEFVGKGRSAVVYKIRGTNRVIKAYFPPYVNLAKKEAAVYSQVSINACFTRCYEAGQGYIILEYIEGMTLFDCLVRGIPIPLEALQVIDTTFEMLEVKGIYPVDMHLKNLMLTSDDAIKVIDVVRYSTELKDQRWKDFRRVYNKYYQRQFIPKRYPRWILHVLGSIYKRWFEKRV